MYLLISVVGVVFGGIHCAGWLFNFPSYDEAMLWRVSSAVLTTGIALLLPLLYYLIEKAPSSDSFLCGVFFFGLCFGIRNYRISPLVHAALRDGPRKQVIPGSISLVLSDCLREN